MFYGKRQGIFAFSPTEPNPDKDPFMRAYNPSLMLAGIYVQSQGLMKEEVYSDKEAGHEFHMKEWETHEEIVERLREYSKGLADKFNGHGKKFVKKQRYLITYYRHWSGIVPMRWAHAKDMKEMFEFFGTYLNTMATRLERKQEQPMDFCLFSQENLLLSTYEF